MRRASGKLSVFQTIMAAITTHAENATPYNVASEEAILKINNRLTHPLLQNFPFHLILTLTDSTTGSANYAKITTQNTLRSHVVLTNDLHVTIISVRVLRTKDNFNSQQIPIPSVSLGLTTNLYTIC